MSPSGADRELPFVWACPRRPTNLSFLDMGTIKEIEAAVSKLSPKELAEFRAWLERFDADAWDRRFERDATNGRLDGLAAEALRDLHEGRCTDL